MQVALIIEPVLSSVEGGSVFLLPEFTPGVCLLAFLPGAAFFAFGKKMSNTNIENRQYLRSGLPWMESTRKVVSQ